MEELHGVYQINKGYHPLFESYILNESQRAGEQDCLPSTVRPEKQPELYIVCMSHQLGE